MAILGTWIRRCPLELQPRGRGRRDKTRGLLANSGGQPGARTLAISGIDASGPEESSGAPPGEGTTTNLNLSRGCPDGFPVQRPPPMSLFQRFNDLLDHVVLRSHNDRAERAEMRVSRTLILHCDAEESRHAERLDGGAEFLQPAAEGFLAIIHARNRLKTSVEPGMNRQRGANSQRIECAVPVPPLERQMQHPPPVQSRKLINLSQQHGQSSRVIRISSSGDHPMHWAISKTWKARCSTLVESGRERASRYSSRMLANARDNRDAPGPRA